MLSDIKIEATGKWLGIFRELGVDIPEDGKHGECPICGKKKHFRFDDLDGKGTWICVCSSGDGFKLVKEVLNIDYKETFESVRKVLGMCKKVVPREKKPISRESLRKVFDGATRLRKGDLVDLYLANRGIKIRPTQNVWYGRNVWEPETRSEQKAMLCVFSLPDSEAICVHRTYLDDDGNKLNIEKPKKITPALKKMNGGAIRLFPVDGYKIMGVAEGVETAIMASQEMNIPFWSCCSAKLLEAWIPPEHIENIMIVGDNDKSFTGQASAYKLANKLTLQYRKKATVYIPARKGFDFLDEVLARN